ncbi:phage protein NinX family protein [Xenorhabdus indica]|uniref:phage protein NinX family protein n=1 Tax=Xenorhabdus indica TaxID=333964 RepID=UPI001656BFE0|nr:phage protein NinX family protein [Xenorhabdus indica]MBC8947274.1 hypothetical protein [Xenorhabdus indica]
MKIKTSELTGQALDWAMALSLGAEICSKGRFLELPSGHFVDKKSKYYSFKPSTNWTQCGQLIEEYKVQFVLVSDAIIEASSHLMNKKLVVAEFGSNHLEAVCRLIVLGKLGDEVEIPDELLEAE